MGGWRDTAKRATRRWGLPSGPTLVGWAVALAAGFCLHPFLVPPARLGGAAAPAEACPYAWHGGAPSGEPRGSCWVGADDGYAMCTPSLAIDLVIETADGVVLVRRGDDGRYATMGGFVDVGEALHDAVMRELFEETGLQLVDVPRLLGVYGDPKRDKRRHTVSVAYVAPTLGTPRAGSDAMAIETVPFDRLLSLDLAFDHMLIIEDYLADRRARWRIDDDDETRNANKRDTRYLLVRDVCTTP